jgi:hypothetical protein
MHFIVVSAVDARSVVDCSGLNMYSYVHIRYVQFMNQTIEPKEFAAGLVSWFVLRKSDTAVIIFSYFYTHCGAKRTHPLDSCGANLRQVFPPSAAQLVQTSYISFPRLHDPVF